MNSIIVESVSKIIIDFLKHLQDNEIDINNVSVVDIKNFCEKDTPKQPNKKIVPSKDVNSEVSAVKQENTSTKNGCEYIITRGANANKKCGKSTKLGNNMCSQHDKQTSKKNIAQTTVSNSAKDEESSKSNDEKDEPLPTTNKTKAVALISKVMKVDNTVVKDPKTGKFYNKETGFVFEQSTKKVVGKLVKDKVEPLTPEDKKICVQRKFEYFEDNTPSAQDVECIDEPEEEISEIEEEISLEDDE